MADWKMAKKKNGSSQDSEMEQLSRAELIRLRRQYRIMEGDREAYSDEMRILLQKQRKAIELLEREKSRLVYDLNSVKCPASEIKSEKNAAKLKRLLQCHKKLAKEIVREKARGKEFDSQIGKMEKGSAKAKRSLGERLESEGDHLRTKRAQTQLENRLEVATVKLNLLLASNRELRMEIDHVLKERSLFNQSRRELTGKLRSGKKVMADLMEQTNLAHDQREEAQAKLEALRQRGNQRILVHSQKTKELQRKLDRDVKLHEFLGVKGQRRIMADSEAKESLRKQHQKELVEQRIRHHECLLRRIRDVSREADVDRLSAQFLKQEEENFALFNYVNELNDELETLQDQLEEVTRSVGEQRRASEKKVLEKRMAKETLGKELEERKAGLKAAEGSLEECRAASQELLAAIELIHDLLKSDDNPILQLLGEAATTVTEHNVSLYLEAIERGAKDLSRLVRRRTKISPQSNESLPPN